MANRVRVASEARLITRAQLIALGRELRVARVTSGKRQVDIGREIAVSSVHISRIERGPAPGVGFRTLASMAAVLGLRLWVRAFPVGRRMLDAPQLRLYTLFIDRAGSHWSWRTEVPIPIPGDLRAADAVGSNQVCTVHVELITRLGDFQAQARSAQLKRRDLQADRLILVYRHHPCEQAGTTRGAGRRPRVVSTHHAAGAGGTRPQRRPGADGIVLL